MILGVGFFDLCNGLADLQGPFLVSIFGLGSCIIYNVLILFFFFFLTFIWLLLVLVVACGLLAAA